MVSANTLCKNVLNVKNTVIENFNLYSDEDGVKHDTSVMAALKAIDELMEEGYTFVTVEEILFD